MNVLLKTLLDAVEQLIVAEGPQLLDYAKKRLLEMEAKHSSAASAPETK